jgi:hypothetical protein
VKCSAAAGTSEIPYVLGPKGLQVVDHGAIPSAWTHPACYPPGVGEICPVCASRNIRSLPVSATVTVCFCKECRTLFTIQRGVLPVGFGEPPNSNRDPSDSSV